MQGLHVFWTAPYRWRTADLSPDFGMGPAEIMVMAASALIWRAHSGRISLFTDRLGRETVENWGIASCWTGIDCHALDAAPGDINPGVFWDLGKTIAISASDLPIACLDLDFIAWHPLQSSGPVEFLHWEEIESPWYPPLDQLAVPPRYSFPHLDWMTRPGNTALTIIRDAEFRQMFVTESMRYARGNRATQAQALAAFLFSGQRLFTSVCTRLPDRLHPIIPYIYRINSPSEWLGTPLTEKDPLGPHSFLEGWPYLHLWKHKHRLRSDPAEASRYIEALITHAEKQLPAVAQELHRIWREMSRRSRR